MLPIKPKVILNAGHHLKDSGAVYASKVERDEAKKIRDKAKYYLEREGIEVLCVPDELDLAESIAWANKQAPELYDALAIDIHLNASFDGNASGAEAYHGLTDSSKKIALNFSKTMATRLGIPDRGAKPHTDASVGSLGWITKTKAWATLVETCFITNNGDMAKLQSETGYSEAGKAIRDATLMTMGMILPEDDTVLEDLEKALIHTQSLEKLLKKTIEEYTRV